RLANPQIGFDQHLSAPGEHGLSIIGIQPIEIFARMRQRRLQPLLKPLEAGIVDGGRTRCDYDATRQVGMVESEADGYDASHGEADYMRATVTRQVLHHSSQVVRELPR